MNGEPSELMAFPEDMRIGEQVDSKSIAPHGVAGSSPVSSALYEGPEERSVLRGLCHLNASRRRVRIVAGGVPLARSCQVEDSMHLQTSGIISRLTEHVLPRATAAGRTRAGGLGTLTQRAPIPCRSSSNHLNRNVIGTKINGFLPFMWVNRAARESNHKGHGCTTLVV